VAREGEGGKLEGKGGLDRKKVEQWGRMRTDDHGCEEERGTLQRKPHHQELVSGQEKRGCEYTCGKKFSAEGRKTGHQYCRGKEREERICDIVNREEGGICSSWRNDSAGKHGGNIINKNKGN